jgi:hypothetical protein
MRHIIEIYRLSGFPGNAKIPFFRDKHAIGPNFAYDLSVHLRIRGSKAECLDFDTDEISEIDKDSDIIESGDLLYLIYKNPDDWIYIFSTDLSWGVVLSNIDFAESEDVNSLDNSEKDFSDSYLRRTTNQALYYEVQILRDWARVAGLASSSS